MYDSSESSRCRIFVLVLLVYIFTQKAQFDTLSLQKICTDPAGTLLIIIFAHHDNAEILCTPGRVDHPEEVGPHKGGA